MKAVKNFKKKTRIFLRSALLSSPKSSETQQITEEILELEKEIAYREGQDPLLYRKFNPAQLRMFDAFKDAPRLCVNTCGNGIGKTYAHIALLSAVCFGTESKIFDAPIFKKWPYPKFCRIVSDTKMLEDTGPVQAAIADLFPKGRYKMTRGVGKGYYSAIYCDTGFFIDLMTYNQSPAEFAGHTLGLILFIEPPPKLILSESLSRLRAGGIADIEMTPLDQAAFIKFDYLDKGDFRDEGGRVVGKVRHVTGDFHENCRDCHPGGQLKHDDIMATIASWPIEEREARRYGRFMEMAGLIYRSYGDHNEIETLSPWHQECFENGFFTLYNVLDPHDTKPFALAWFMVFPNLDWIGAAEYPLEPFEGMPNPKMTPDEYRAFIIETEKSFGKPADIRLVDRAKGNAPALNGPSIKSIFSESCESCQKSDVACPHRLYFIDAPNDLTLGHLLMRKDIGNPLENKPPKFSNMKHCINLCTGHRRYGYKIGKNKKVDIHERPELEFKDFCDLSRYLKLYGIRYLGEQKPLYRVKRTRRGKGYVAL